MSSILISGGGIAGLALSFWLQRAGHDVVVIERAEKFEPLGHYITLKSGGVEVIRQMGLLAACHSRALDFSEVRLVTASGELLRMIDFAEMGNTLSGMIAFRRSDLHQAIFDAVRDKVEIRYDETISAVKQTPDSVEITFKSGGTDKFDLLAGADGLHSVTRRMVFEDGFERLMGGSYFALTVKRRHSLVLHRAQIFMGQGQIVLLFPTDEETVSALVYCGDAEFAPAGRDAMSIKLFLLKMYADFSSDVLDTFHAIDEASYVFMDTIGQIVMPSIVRGRVALVGDAAHCPTFMSGMGSSLALQGAQTMARCLGAERDIPRALLNYQTQIRPIADGYQNSAKGMRPFFLDRRLRYALLRNSVLRLTPEFVMKGAMRRYYQAELV